VGLDRAALEDLVSKHACRFCGAPLRHSFADLGSSPLANSYLRADELEAPEPFYPLHARVCERCFLVQLPAVESPEAIFGEYAYFSSTSASWVEHARRYAESAVRRFGLDERSQVLEVASNDGYLLQFFRERGVPVLGIEPARNVAEAAVARGIPTRVEFFGTEAARRLVAEGTRADLLVANNVLAHTPSLNDFVEAIAVVLVPDGVATLEFPHLLRLIERSEFDTIYHEHFSYFSLLVVERVFERAGLTIVDVEELPTHGGSLRVYARHAQAAGRKSESIESVRTAEQEAGLGGIEVYAGFEARVRAAKRDLLELLVAVKREGRSVVAYGAAAKGATLLNYCGIRGDFVDYVVDRSPHKQGLFMPGVHLPIHPPERVAETRPDYLLLLAWNLREEIAQQMQFVREWGCRFVAPLPTVEVT
jgi:SAM-dependent methyltransferase